MNTGDVCTNTSYAAIIRRDGNRYTMIARTLLTPEDSTNEGVRFQFIQNEVIRVQKDCQDPFLPIVSPLNNPFRNANICAMCPKKLT